MVQLMGSLHSGNFEDFTEDEYGSLPKRSRIEAAAPSNQHLSCGNHALHVPPLHYNPLAEPSPLGLRLKKSPSLLDLIQMAISQRSSSSFAENTTEITSHGSKKDTRGIAASSASDKLKASNFPASLLRIGSWEYVSKHEGDLVAKCYFAKHKLVWEVLDGGLKSKIEIQWSEITALKAEFPDDGPGSLTIVLARQPAFFRETNPQPRKHTLWQATTDFTDGQASLNKQHFLQFPPGTLDKHYEKLLQCDMRLSVLSQQPEIVLDSPFFKSQASVCEISEESAGNGGNQQPRAAQRSPISAFNDVASSTAPQLRASKFGKNPLVVQNMPKEATSPSSSSGIDTQALEGNMKNIEHDSREPKSRESLVLPRICPSMSMTDLVNHLGNCISEQVTSGSLPSDKASECHDMLENISQVLLSDTHWSTGLDERSLMKKVNSLCNLLQDPVIASTALGEAERCNQVDDPARNVYFDLANDSVNGSSSNIMQATEVNFAEAPGLPRKDSFSDLLLHLPRIASLPRFSNLLYGIAEDEEYQSP